MHVYRYWGRAAVDDTGVPDPSGSFRAVGWSETSQAEADDFALTRAKRIRNYFMDGAGERLEEYYAERPPREPLVEELRHEGRVLAAITRNIYGAFVLNAAEAMFVDLDTEPLPHPPVGASLDAWVDEDRALQRVQLVMSEQRGLTMRLYRTAAGYRGLITSRAFDPSSKESSRLLKRFAADRLYARLCMAQNCYRARLSPKPWRCGIGLPPGRYPWIDDDRERAFDQWSAKYESLTQSYATCEYLGTFGDDDTAPDIQPVVDLHDRYTLKDSGRLA